MSDVILLALAVILIVAVPFDWYAAGKLVGEAVRPPTIATLNLAAFRSVAIAVAATCFAILGVSSIVFVASGQVTRILPTPVPAILIALGALVISLPNVYFLHVLERWKAESRDFHGRRHDDQ